MIHLASNYDQARFWINISSTGWCTYAFFGLWFYLDFTGHKVITENKLFLALLALPSLLFVYLQWSGHLVTEVELMPYGWVGYWALPGVAYAFFAYYAVMNLVCIGLCLTLKNRDNNLRRKKQIILLVFTASISFILGSVTDVILPSLRVSIIPQMADVIIAVWGIGIILAITKYGLLGLTPSMAGRTIIDTMIDSLLLVDKEGKIVFSNEAANTLIGDQSKLEGRHFISIVANQEQAEKFLSTAFNSIHNTNVELMFRAVNGREIPMEVSLSVISNDLEPVIGLVIVARDDSYRIQNELEIIAQRNLIHEILQNVPNAVVVVDENLKIIVSNKAFNRLIQPQIADDLNIDSIFSDEKFLKNAMSIIKNEKSTCQFEFRQIICESEKIFTAKIVNMGQLKALVMLDDRTRERERQEKLYLADRLATVGEMASGIAHELNNPLTSVIALSKLLKDQDLPDDVREDISSINSEAQRAAVIVKNMLTFARKHPAVMQLTSINKIIEDVVKIRSYEHKINNIKVQTNLSDTLPSIMANYFQIQQVFLNIVLNAEEALHEVSSSNRFLTINTETEDGYIKISITDTGTGISKENMDRLFDPFFTTKGVGKGTGLGLSICYGIISSHKGRIRAQSEMNRGTTFIIELPVEMENDENDESSIPDESGKHVISIQ